jgi:hypothetical protein
MFFLLYLNENTYKFVSYISTEPTLSFFTASYGDIKLDERFILAPEDEEIMDIDVKKITIKPVWKYSWKIIVGWIK